VRERLLDPVARMSEILFGLIMALTFTGTLDVATAGRTDVRMLLVGTIGCNLAWGLVDGVMFLISALTERGRNLVTVRAVRAASSPDHARRIIADALPPVVASIMSDSEIDSLRRGFVALPSLPVRPALVRDDWMKAVAIFLLVFLSTFPVVIPFIFMHSAVPALRVSNAIAVVMLFLTGYAFGRMSGRHPWLVGISMVLLGAGLVAMTMALGG